MTAVLAIGSPGRKAAVDALHRGSMERDVVDSSIEMRGSTTQRIISEDRGSVEASTGVTRSDDSGRNHSATRRSLRGRGARMPAIAPHGIDAETKIADSPADHREDARLWLLLLTCTTLIETELRRKLQTRFDATLPRYDLLAQLDKAPDGLVLGEVSKRMMVSAGNVTAIVERLIASGTITRTPAPHDRRVQIIRMTANGRTTFDAMARDYGACIADMFDGLSPQDIEMLMCSLSKLKASVHCGLSAPQAF